MVVRQRLMVLEVAAPLAAEQPEALVESCRDLRRGHRDHPRRRELDGEGYPVEAAADVGDVGVGPRVGGHLRVRRTGTVAEQLLGRAVDARTCRCDVERLHRPHLLAVDAERLPARREDADAWAPVEDIAREGTGGIEDVLAVVEDDEDLLLPEEVDDADVHGDALARLDAEGQGDDLGERLGVADRRELADPRAVTEPGHELGGGVQGEAGLPHAPHARERDESRVGSASVTAVTVCARPTNDVRWTGRLPGKASSVASGGNSAVRPGAVSWKMCSGRERSRSRCSPRSTRPNPGGRPSRTTSSVACDTRTWPPCAAPMSRAARLTAGP